MPKRMKAVPEEERRGKGRGRAGRGRGMSERSRGELEGRAKFDWDGPECEGGAGFLLLNSPLLSSLLEAPSYFHIQVFLDKNVLLPIYTTLPHSRVTNHCLFNNYYNDN